MNELSCINVMLFGAAPTRAAPSSPPTADSAEIVSTSRRDAARMMFAIRLTLPWYRPSVRIVTCHAAYLPRVAQVMGRESLKSTVCQTEPYQFRHLAPESAIGALSGPLDAPAPYPSEPTNRAREQCDGRRLGQRIISNGLHHRVFRRQDRIDIGRSGIIRILNTGNVRRRRREVAIVGAATGLVHLHQRRGPAINRIARDRGTARRETGGIGHIGAGRTAGPEAVRIHRANDRPGHIVGEVGGFADRRSGAATAQHFIDLMLGHGRRRRILARPVRRRGQIAEGYNAVINPIAATDVIARTVEARRRAGSGEPHTDAQERGSAQYP